MERARIPILIAAFFRAQVLDVRDYRLQSEKNRLRQVPLLAPRGAIFDRHNAIIAENVPGYTVKNPHTFLTNLGGASTPFAVAAQQQLATFLASAGTVTIDPDGAGPFFETPIGGLLPETLNFIP